MSLIKFPLLIAIDGPAGSGKGTIAKIVSKKLNLNYLDSGAIYRLIAYAAIREKINLNDIESLLILLKKIDIDFDEDQIFVDSFDVSDHIRNEEVGRAASVIAKYADLRKELLTFQRNFFQGNGLVAEGRDMTTVVFPDAHIKIYLDASIEERVKRRHKQLILKGKGVNIQILRKNIIARDTQDKERTYSPLLKADDAIILDTNHLDIDQTVTKIAELVFSRFKS
jgi:cytidylate kinase